MDVRAIFFNMMYITKLLKVLSGGAVIILGLAACQGDTNTQTDAVTTVPDTVRIEVPQDQTEVGTRRNAGSGILGTGTSARTADTIRPLNSQIDSSALR